MDELTWGEFYKEFIIRENDKLLCYNCTKAKNSTHVNTGKSYDVTFNVWNPDDFECDYYEDKYLG